MIFLRQAIAFLALSILSLSPCGLTGADIIRSEDSDLGVRVYGDEDFTSHITQALVLIRDKAPDAFSMIERYSGVIQEGKRSIMWVYKDPPLLEFNPMIVTSSVTWCAGVIASCSYQSFLYNENKELRNGHVPDFYIFIGEPADTWCIEYQIKVMKMIGAPGDEISDLEDLLYYMN